MTQRVEYKMLKFDMVSEATLNSLAAEGWRVAHVVPPSAPTGGGGRGNLSGSIKPTLILEREVAKKFTAAAHK